MIARIWHGVVPAAKSKDYLVYLNQTGIPDYRNTAGNEGVKILHRIEGEQAHFLLITYWDSWDSIKKFAGEDIRKARYYPEDESYLLELEPYVEHYEVLV